MSSETINVLSHEQQKSTLTELSRKQIYPQDVRWPTVIGKAKESGLENKQGKGSKQPEQEPKLMQWNTTAATSTLDSTDHVTYSHQH